MEFLKEILGEELYSQLESKISSHNADEKNKDNQIKIVNLSTGNYVGKEKFDAKETELAGVKQQLAEASTTIKSYEDMDIESIKKSAKDWEEKYTTDTEELQKKLAKKDYDHIIEKKVDTLKFSSVSAKKAFTTDLIAKELKLENDNLLGFDDFVKEYKESDPGAFTKEEESKPKPTFGSPTPGDEAGVSELEDFMSVMGINK